MAKSINASLEIEKNKLQSGGMINLFEIEVVQAVNATPSSYVYWAQWNASLTYFVPASSTTQVYSPMPIERGDLEQDDGSKVPSMQIAIGAVDQTIVSYLENNDALRGARVRALSVPYDLLTNASAYLMDTFYIDGGTIDHAKEVAVFELTSKGNISEVTVPFRRMRRDQCPWKYNGSECLATSGGSGYLTAFSDRVCKHTKDDCASKNAPNATMCGGNVRNFGGFPGIGTRAVAFK